MESDQLDVEIYDEKRGLYKTTYGGFIVKQKDDKIIALGRLLVGKIFPLYRDDILICLNKLKIETYDESFKDFNKEEIALQTDFEIRNKYIMNIDQTFEKPKARKFYYREEFMRLMNDILLCNYWDKKRGNAILLDAKKINNLLVYLKNTNIMDMVKNCNRIGKYFKDHISMEIEEKYMYNKIMKNCPLIFGILELGKGKISLCGDAVIDIIFYNGIENYDIYFHCNSVKEADNILSACVDYLRKNYDGFSYIISLNVLGFKAGGFNINFIRGIYKSKDQILMEFDLAGSRIGYNPFDGIFTTLCGAFAYALRAFPIDLSQRNSSNGNSLHKYVFVRCFNVLLLGFSENLNRSLIDDPKGTLEKYVKKYDEYMTDDKNMTDDEDMSNNENCINLISEELYQNVIFRADNYEDIIELPDQVITKSIDIIQDVDYIENLTKEKIKDFMNDYGLYKEFAMAYYIDEDCDKYDFIWKERCNWYLEKGRECAKMIKDNPWGYENKCTSMDPREWYGDCYEPFIVGISNERFGALLDCVKNIEYMINIPRDIIKLICDYWLKAEVDIARDGLLDMMK